MRWTLWRQARRHCSERMVLKRRTKTPSVRPSRVVLTPVAGAKFAGSVPRDDGDKRNSLTGESTKYAVKPLRGESRDVSAEPVCSCAPNAQLLAHETAGAVGTRLSLRPLFEERANEFVNPRAKRAARSRNCIPTSSRRRPGP